MGERDADGVFRDTVREIGRAVDGIDDPQIFAARAVGVALLAEEDGAWQKRTQRLAQGFLHGDVSGGHDVGRVVLVADGERICRDAGGLADDADDAVKQRGVVDAHVYFPQMIKGMRARSEVISS